MSKSNYIVKVTPEICTACALCVKRCPMDAIQLKFSTKATNKFRKAVVVDTDICIGCGVCVHKCKPKAITLIRKEELTPPMAETIQEAEMMIAMAIIAGKEREATELKKSNE